MITVAIYYHDNFPFSNKVYVDNVVNRLDKNKINVEFFSSIEEAPKNADLYWVPSMAGGHMPTRQFRKLQPLVITLHCAGPFSISTKEYFGPGIKLYIKNELRKIYLYIQWALLKKSIKKIITVSQYAKKEIISNLPLSSKDVKVIYHGYDKQIFNSNKSDIPRRYFLSISQYHPKKNLERVIQAYERIDDLEFPELIVVSPGFPEERQSKIVNKKIKIISKSLTGEEVAEYMRSAIAFIFPSIHETFGLPVVEAMACGTPVLTSNIECMREISNGHAIYADPYSVESIKDGLELLAKNEEKRSEMAKNAKDWVKYYDWQTSADNHAKLFCDVAEDNKVE